MLAFSHGSKYMTLAYVPILMWAVDRLLEKTNPLNMAIMALLLGFQLQRAHVQVAYYTLFLLGLYVG